MEPSTWRAWLRRYQFPLAALGLCLLAFGLLIPWLGFYWDDWLAIFHAQGGQAADFIRLYSYDRPFSAWTALLSTPLLGTSPLAWHLFSLLLRWLLALAMAWALELTWPRRRQAIQWAALLFAVYPAFFLQPVAVAFSQHLIAYTLFFVSLGAMLAARRQPGRLRLWTLLALATQLLHLLTVEYFAGLELLRPLLLYAVFTENERGWRENLRRTLMAWLPYLGLLALVSFWRVAWLELPLDPHELDLLAELRAKPLAAGLTFLQDIVQSLVHLLVGAWQRVTAVELFDLRDRSGLLAWTLGALAAVGLYLWGRGKDDEDQAEIGDWIWIGLLAILLGLLPGFLIGKQPIEAGYNERFALPALLGAALVWVGLLRALVGRRRPRILILSILIGLAVAGHLRTANEFRADWDQQQRLYQQLAWRAPDIEADTALVSFQRLSPFMQNSSVSAALNALYPQPNGHAQVDYWNFDLSFSVNVEALKAGRPLSRHYRGMQFQAEDAGANLFYFLPESGCLWVLGPLDADNQFLPFETRRLAAYANPGRILPTERAGAEAAAPIFGEANSDSWCWYYQRAELARQQGDWQEVLAIMEAAEAAGHNADNAYELMGLVEAYAHLGRWAAAADLSAEIYQRHSLNGPMLCALWAQIDLDVGVDAGLLGEMRDLTACQAP